MRLIYPEASIVQCTENAMIFLEKMGRTCYKSEDRMDAESADKFLAGIIKRGHESVLEHASATFNLICDRGVSHELVRHRIASYSQESTRYCNYACKDMEFIIPSWLSKIIKPQVVDEYQDVREITTNSKAVIWMSHCRDCETRYDNLLHNGWKPQQARSILPNSLKTEIKVTMNFRQWRHFFRLRTAKAAHPDMQAIAEVMHMQLYNLYPVIFEGLEEKEGHEALMQCLCPKCKSVSD